MTKKETHTISGMVHVNAYKRDDGTPVKDYYRSWPDGAEKFGYAYEQESNANLPDNNSVQNKNVSPEEIAEVINIVIFLGIEAFKLYGKIKSKIEEAQEKLKKNDYKALDNSVQMFKTDLKTQKNKLIEYKSKMDNLSPKNYQKALSQYKQMEETYKKTSIAVENLSNAVENKDNEKIEQNLSELNDNLNLDKMKQDLLNNDVLNFNQPAYNDSVKNQGENYDESTPLLKSGVYKTQTETKDENEYYSKENEESDSNQPNTSDLALTYVPESEEELLSSAELVKNLCYAANCINKRIPYDPIKGVEIIDKDGKNFEF